MEQDQKLKFIRLKTLEPDCRCCGHGTKHICDKCYRLLKRGYAFFIEVKDSSTEKRKKPTGYAIAFEAAQVKDTETGEPYQAGIYFVRHSDLRKFLGDDYNNYRTRGADKGKLLSDIRKLAYKGAVSSVPSVTELVQH